MVGVMKWMSVTDDFGVKKHTMASATFRKPAMLAPACRCVLYSFAALADA